MPVKSYEKKDQNKKSKELLFCKAMLLTKLFEKAYHPLFVFNFKLSQFWIRIRYLGLFKQIKMK